jgi:hypothetical protein
MFSSVFILIDTAVGEESPLAVTTLLELHADVLCVPELPEWTFGMCGVLRQPSREGPPMVSL